MSGSLLRALLVAGALVSAGGLHAATSSSPSPPRDPSKLTLKERSGGKAMDEQRVNDCKVPYEQRGDHRRSPDCPTR
jgi:hypothetical protein